VKPDELNLQRKKTKKSKSIYRGLFERMIIGPLVFLLLGLSGLYSVNEWVLKPISIQQQKLLSNQQQVNQLNRQISHYQQYAVEFESEAAQTILQPLNKIEWVDKMMAYSQNARLSNVNLNIGEELPLDAAQTSRIPQAQNVFFQTPIVIDAGLFHEGDFVRFVDWLYLQNEYLWLESCRLTSQVTGSEKVWVFDINQPNINARCQFISFRAEPRMFNEDEWR
jgi:hypothetical protein